MTTSRHRHGSTLAKLGLLGSLYFSQGLPFGFFTQALPVLLRKASMGVLWNGAQFRAMHFEDYFELVPLSWTSEIAVGPFRIRSRRTIHHVPTSALLIETAGRKLGYSSDTAFDPALIEFLAPADLIIHETNLGPAHTPYTSLAALPSELRARMRLIHYPDDFDTASSAIAALHEGEVLRP